MLNIVGVVFWVQDGVPECGRALHLPEIPVQCRLEIVTKFAICTRMHQQASTEYLFTTMLSRLKHSAQGLSPTSATLRWSEVPSRHCLWLRLTNQPVLVPMQYSAPYLHHARSNMHQVTKKNVIVSITTIGHYLGGPEVPLRQPNPKPLPSPTPPPDPNPTHILNPKP